MKKFPVEKTTKRENMVQHQEWDGHKVTFLSCDWSDDHYHNAFISFIQDVTHVQSMTPGHNQDVPNPNAINRPLAWPIRVKSSISMDMQVS